MALLTHTAASSSNGSSVTTSAIDTTGATLLIVYQTAGTLATPTDNKTNTWTKLNTATSQASSAIYYCLNPVVGTGHTFSVTASFPSLCVAGFSGISAYDGTQTTSTVSPGTSLATGNITPSQSGCLIVTGMGGLGTANYQVNNGFTVTDFVALASGVAYGSGLAYYIQGAAAAIGTTWTWTTSANCESNIAAFRSVASVGGNLLLMGCG